MLNKKKIDGIHLKIKFMVNLKKYKLFMGYLW